VIGVDHRLELRDRRLERVIRVLRAHVAVDQGVQAAAGRAGSTVAVKPVITPSRRSRRTRSAAALALRPTRAPRVAVREPRVPHELTEDLAVCGIHAASIAVFTGLSLEKRSQSI
jgi:hypothetical protein